MKARLAVLLTHPVQYMAPWFRHMTRHCAELELTVIYATEPTPEQQGTGFGRSFRWDVPLTDGYDCVIARPARPGDDVGSDAYHGLDVPEASKALLAARPDVALIPGWHSATYTRALRACRRAGIPVLYRGDSNFLSGPRGWKRLPWALHTRRRLAAYAAWLAVGRRSEAYLRHFGVPEKKIFSSPHAVDNPAFAAAAAPYQSPEGRRAARAALGLGEDAFVPLFVGKLEAKKRPLDLIEAVAGLRLPTQPLIVGSGALEETCRRRAEELGLDAVWMGFLNQSELPRAYGAADCLVLPSDARETWGLVLNEALACGLPCVVSQQVGGAPDLVEPGVTGELFPTGDTERLARALTRVRALLADREAVAAACRQKAAEYSFNRATAGLLDACRALRPTLGTRSAGAIDSSKPVPRVLAACGNMVIVSGLERMTFAALGSLHRRGAAIHCVVNDWENHRIVALADRLPASWSTGPNQIALSRRERSWKGLASMITATIGTSLALLRDAASFRPTHVLVPDHVTAARNAPALALLRLLGGVSVVLRLPNRPDSTPFYRWLWGRMLPRVVDRFVVNSRFTEGRLREVGAPDAKIRRIENAVAERPAATRDTALLTRLRARPTLLTVGQIAPFKGTHWAVEAALALLAEGRDIQAAVVGPPPVWPPELQAYDARIRKAVATAGAEDRILFLGRREDVPELMASSYLLVAPIPEEESFGNVALEAKNAGLPVVAFPAGGLAELVQDGVTGLLCQDQTLAGLLAALRFFLDHPERREAAALASRRDLERSDSPYRREVFEERWWSLFQETLR